MTFKIDQTKVENRVMHWTSSFTSACMDALNNPEVRNLLKSLDSKEQHDAFTVLLSAGGLFMPLAKSGIQIAYNVTALVAKEMQPQLTNAANAEALYILFTEFFDKSRRGMTREIVKNATMIHGPFSPDFTENDFFMELMWQHFDENYIDRSGTPWMLDKTKIQRDMSKKLKDIIVKWKGIPTRCHSESLVAALRSDMSRRVLDPGWDYGRFSPEGQKVMEQTYKSCVARERKTLNDRLRLEH
jgi:hypothetical protein